MKPQVVSFHYTLKDKAGKTIESSHKSDPVVCMEGAGQIIPGLEKVLFTLKAGDKKEVFVKSADAYGEMSQELIVQVPRAQLPKTKETLKVGSQFWSQSQDGHQQMFVVTQLNDTHATLDGNHPLAGQDLTFDIEVMERRAATDEEMAHGHAHGPHGHHQ